MAYCLPPGAIRRGLRKALSRRIRTKQPGRAEGEGREPKSSKRRKLKLRQLQNMLGGQRSNWRIVSTGKMAGKGSPAIHRQVCAFSLSGALDGRVGLWSPMHLAPRGLRSPIALPDWGAALPGWAGVPRKRGASPRSRAGVARDRGASPPGRAGIPLQRGGVARTRAAVPLPGGSSPPCPGALAHGR
jgi:hypothetical protein